MKKIFGVLIFFVVIGMALMLIIFNRLAGLVVIALLLFVCFICLSDSCRK